jgi:hypothetical protein
MALISTKEFCSWPEYMALAKRLGIPSQAKAVTIKLRVNEAVVIECEYLPSDKAQPESPSLEGESQ